MYLAIKLILSGGYGFIEWSVWTGEEALDCASPISQSSVLMTRVSGRSVGYSALRLIAVALESCDSLYIHRQQSTSHLTALS